jgi:hypothetical protein
MNENLSYNETLRCHWDSWRVISESHLILYLPHNNVPDMSGTIKIAKFLSPNVDRVDVYSGCDLEIQYFGNYNQKWKSLSPVKKNVTKVKEIIN